MTPDRDPSTYLTLVDTPFETTEFTRLWVLATATYGVGDVVTTVALMEYSPTVEEGNVLLRMAIEAFGQAGLVGLKLVAFALCLAISLDAARSGDRVLYYAPPAGLILFGTFVTVYNVRLMLG